MKKKNKRYTSENVLIEKARRCKALRENGKIVAGATKHRTYCIAFVRPPTLRRGYEGLAITLPEEHIFFEDKDILKVNAKAQELIKKYDIDIYTDEDFVRALEKAKKKVSK